MARRKRRREKRAHKHSRFRRTKFLVFRDARGRFISGKSELAVSQTRFNRPRRKSGRFGRGNKAGKQVRLEPRTFGARIERAEAEAATGTQNKIVFDLCLEAQRIAFASQVAADFAEIEDRLSREERRRLIILWRAGAQEFRGFDLDGFRKFLTDEIYRDLFEDEEEPDGRGELCVLKKRVLIAVKDQFGNVARVEQSYRLAVGG